MLSGHPSRSQNSQVINDLSWEPKANVCLYFFLFPILEFASGTTFTSISGFHTLRSEKVNRRAEDKVVLFLFFCFFFFLFCTLMHLEQYVLPLVWNLWKRRCTLTRKSLKTVPIKTNQSLHYIMTSFFVLQSSADGVVPKNFFCLFVFFWCQKKRLCHL